MPKHPSRVELTRAEWTLIKTVWSLEPCTAPDVQEALARSTAWTYSTVRTLLDRMVAKGLLHTGKLRHITLYRSAITRAQAQRGELLYALQHAFDGALSPMVQCLLDTHDLDSAELEAIEKLIKTKRKQRSTRR